MIIERMNEQIIQSMNQSTKHSITQSINQIKNSPPTRLKPVYFARKGELLPPDNNDNNEQSYRRIELCNTKIKNPTNCYSPLNTTQYITSLVWETVQTPKQMYNVKRVNVQG